MASVPQVRNTEQYDPVSWFEQTILPPKSVEHRFILSNEICCETDPVKNITTSFGLNKSGYLFFVSEFQKLL